MTASNMTSQWVLPFPAIPKRTIETAKLQNTKTGHSVTTYPDAVGSSKTIECHQQHAWNVSVNCLFVYTWKSTWIQCTSRNAGQWEKICCKRTCFYAWTSNLVMWIYVHLQVEDQEKSKNYVRAEDVLDRTDNVICRGHTHIYTTMVKLISIR